MVAQGEDESEDEEYEEEEFYSGHLFSAPHCLLYTSVLLGSTGLVLATVCYPATWLLVLLLVLNSLDCSAGSCGRCGCAAWRWPGSPWSSSCWPSSPGPAAHTTSQTNKSVYKFI